MSTGEIIFAVMVAMQGLLFIIGAAIIIAVMSKKWKEASDKRCYAALILWAISPIFPIIGGFFALFL